MSPVLFFRIMQAVSSGLSMKYYKRHLHSSKCEEIKQGTQAVSMDISLDHVKTIFVLLLAGLTVSATVLCMEHLSFGNMSGTN